MNAAAIFHGQLRDLCCTSFSVHGSTLMDLELRAGSTFDLVMW